MDYTFPYLDARKLSMTIAIVLMVLAGTVMMSGGMPWQIMLAWSPLIFVKFSNLVMEDFGRAVLLALLTIQSAHFMEHIAQVYEIHMLGIPFLQAHGIFGFIFDAEWLHFFFDTGWIPLNVGVLIAVFGYRDRVAWSLLLVAIWHGFEHIKIMSVYLAFGTIGTPGLLARGGAIGGGLPLSRPDLHFLYNLVEELLIVVLFIKNNKAQRYCQ